MADDPRPPQQGMLDKINDEFRMWADRPLARWFLQRGILYFSPVLGLYLVAGRVLSYSRATQFMIGLVNPYKSPWALTYAEQRLAVAIRIMGWIIFPVVVGATAGLTVAEQLRRLTNK